MVKREVTMYGERIILACDGRCDKAWGINGRPRALLSAKDDDNIFLPDSVLGTAPPPGRTITTSEGFEPKPSAGPLTDGTRMNKWCARECERCKRFKLDEPIVLRDMEAPRPNIPTSKSPFVRDAEGLVRLKVAREVEWRTQDGRASARLGTDAPLCDLLVAAMSREAA